MQNTIIAVDIAKNVFEVAVSHRTGVVAARHRLSRRRFLAFMGTFKPTTVLLEACGSAHHWARELRTLGHASLYPGYGNFLKMPRTIFRSSSDPPWLKQGVKSASLNNGSSISSGNSERCPDIAP